MKNELEPQSPRDFGGDEEGERSSDLKDIKRQTDNNRNSPFAGSLIGQGNMNQGVSPFVSPYLKGQRHPQFRNE